MEPNTEYPSVSYPSVRKDSKDQKEELSVDYPSSLQLHRESDPDYTKYTPITETEFISFADENLEQNEEETMSGIKIHISESVVKDSGILKYTTYLIKGEDEKGAFEVARRYSEFDTLRDVIIERWPGVYVPPIPAKKLIGKTETQTTLNRIRFLNEFLKKVASLPHLYYGEQFQVFLRSSEVEVTKTLEKFKRESYDLLLKKYHEAFNDCLSGEKRLNDNIEKINAFEQFVKVSRPLVVERRKQARDIAEARQAYDDKLGLVFDRILPAYEQGSMAEFTGGDESKYLFAKIHENEDLATKKNKYQQAAKQNPYWLIYDILKFEEREMEAVQDCFKGLHKITDKISDCNRDINNNVEEIQNLELGKTTIRSLLTKGTNEEIIVKLKADNEQLEKHKLLMTELQAVVAEYINAHVIHNFKSSRQRFYTRALRKVSAYDMHYIRMGCHFYEELKQMAQQKIDNYELAPSHVFKKEAPLTEPESKTNDDES